MKINLFSPKMNVMKNFFYFFSFIYSSLFDSFMFLANIAKREKNLFETQKVFNIVCYDNPHILEIQSIDCCLNGIKEDQNWKTIRGMKRVIKFTKFTLKVCPLNVHAYVYQLGLVNVNRLDGGKNFYANFIVLNIKSASLFFFFFSFIQKFHTLLEAEKPFITHTHIQGPTSILANHMHDER